MNELGIGANPIYSSEARPAFSQLSFTQPTAAAAVILFILFKLKPSSIMLMVLVLSLRLGHACFCQHYSMKWTAAGETVTGDGSRLRGSKRLKTTTPATAQGPQHGQRCNPKPTRNQSKMKVTEVVLFACKPVSMHSMQGSMPA